MTKENDMLHTGGQRFRLPLTSHQKQKQLGRNLSKMTDLVVSGSCSSHLSNNTFSAIHRFKKNAFVEALGFRQELVKPQRGPQPRRGI